MLTHVWGWVCVHGELAAYIVTLPVPLLVGLLAVCCQAAAAGISYHLPATWIGCSAGL